MKKLTVRVVQTRGRGYTVCKQQGMAAELELFGFQPSSPSVAAKLPLSSLASDCPPGLVTHCPVRQQSSAQTLGTPPSLPGAG